MIIKTKHSPLLLLAAAHAALAASLCPAARIATPETAETPPIDQTGNPTAGVVYEPIGQ